MYCALKSLIQENNLDAITVKCQYELSQIYKFTPCVSLSLLGDEIPSSCEGDMLTILSQVILSYLTDSVVTYGDIHEVLEDRVLIGACGFSPFSLSEKKDCLVCKWGWEAFNGILNSSPLKNGRVTLARLSRDGEGFKLHAAAGKSIGRSEWNEVGCPPYPGTDIVLNGNPEHFAQQLVSNHYALVFGDVTHELELLCNWLKIKYIIT
jgi:L-fucose isomerase-like protein